MNSAQTSYETDIDPIIKITINAAKLQILSIPDIIYSKKLPLKITYCHTTLLQKFRIKIPSFFTLQHDTNFVSS